MSATVAHLPKKIDLLDHGFVRLVDSMGGDISVVRAARVSYDAEWRAGENEGSDKRLINYLWKHAHTSPFEAVSLTFEVKAPIFVFRQWHRHRGDGGAGSTGCSGVGSGLGNVPQHLTEIPDSVSTVARRI